MSVIESKFEKFNRSDPLVQKLIAFLSDVTADALFHIDLYELADKWQVKRKQMLEMFLLGVREGIFDMEWEFHCSECGGVAKESLRLQEAQTEDYCPVCKVNFQNVLDDNIEVFFSINESIKSLPEAIKKSYLEGAMHDIMEHGKFDWKRPTTIKGSDCVNNSVFRNFFGTDVLPLDQSLAIKHSTVLFTDIKGSTSMYERLGDNAAFQMVRSHFDILFHSIQINNGVAIKTIGDAVMGIFPCESEALQAAVGAQDALKQARIAKENIDPIQIKIGLHSGPTIVVTLNNRLDYFGTTVNLAARIQALAGPNEILFSDDVLKDKRAYKFLAATVKKINKYSAKLKGLKGTHTIYKLIR